MSISCFLFKGIFRRPPDYSSNLCPPKTFAIWHFFGGVLGLFLEKQQEGGPKYPPKSYMANVLGGHRLDVWTPWGHGRPRLRVMDVRTKMLVFFPRFQGLDRSFCPRTSAGISAWTSAGYPAPKLTLWAAFFVLDLRVFRRVSKIRFQKTQNTRKLVFPTFNKFLRFWPSQTDWNWLKLIDIDWNWLKMTENWSKWIESRRESGWKPLKSPKIGFREISHGRWG